MDSIKLTYFNIMGLGEAVRFMLSYCDKEFEDYRILDYKEWQTEIKKTMPFGKLPLLELGENKLHQTLAICRYFGKLSNIAGDDEWEALQIDMIMDTLSDFRSNIWVYFYNRDEQFREKIKPTLFNETVPFYLQKFDDIIKKDGYLANKKLSWGDIYFVAILGYFGFMLKMDICEKYPNIRGLRDKIHAFPNIKKWLEKRPKSEW